MAETDFIIDDLLIGVEQE